MLVYTTSLRKVRLGDIFNFNTPEMKLHIKSNEAELTA